MFDYVIPLISLLFCFMAFLTTMRFILSREGVYWLLPAIISIILFVQNLDLVIQITEMGLSYDPRTLRNIAPLVIAVLYYISIITFHYALRFKIAENRFRVENRKNRTEALFIEKVEQRKRKTERKKKEDNLGNKSREADIYEDKEWTDLFDD